MEVTFEQNITNYQVTFNQEVNEISVDFVQEVHSFETIISPLGERGLKGDKGDTGDTGIQGVNGQDGKSAWQLLQESGYTGTYQDWIDSLSKNDTYIHNQSIPQSVWVVTHNLGYYPSVNVVDSANDFIYGDVKYINNNSLIVTFGAPFGGVAYVS